MKLNWHLVAHDVAQLAGIAQVVLPTLTGLPGWVGAAVAIIATISKHMDNQGITGALKMVAAKLGNGGSAAIIALGLILFSSGCQTPAASVGLDAAITLGSGLALRNNPAYIPAAMQVATDLQSGNITDLTAAGLDTAISKAVQKTGSDQSVTALLEAIIIPPISAYLGAAAEQSLATDPKGQAIVQEIGKDIAAGVAYAQANPKAKELLPPKPISGLPSAWVETTVPWTRSAM